MMKLIDGTKSVLKPLALAILVLACLALTGCSGNVGVGMSVGVPIGNHGYMSIGGNRWY
jgi:hypothetical protein